MNRIKQLFIVAALLVAATSCNNKNKPEESKTYPLVVLINEGGDQMPMDMIGYNEGDLEYEGISMSGNNEQPLMGNFHGLIMDTSNNGYLLMSNRDGYAQVDMSRFKILSTNLLEGLSRPVSMTLYGTNLYILNDGKDAATSAYISIYNTTLGYQYIGKMTVNKGGTALLADENFFYVAGNEGIEMYNIIDGSCKIIETPTRPVHFMVTGNQSVAVSCPGYGICIFDLTTKTIRDSMEVPVGPQGKMAVGKDANDIITFTDKEVYITNIASNSSQLIYEGEAITGAGRSPNTKYTYISESNGASQYIFNDQREQVAMFTAPEGNYSYLFTNRIVYSE